MPTKQCLAVILLAINASCSPNPSNYTGAPKADQPVMCVTDAKQCPDGSYVGREGPDCRFAKCPHEK